MATSARIFIVPVAVAATLFIAVFALTATGRRRKRLSAAANERRTVPDNQPPRSGLREAWSDETASDAEPHRRQQLPLNSSTTQWDRADRMEPIPQPPQTRGAVDHQDEH